jgi:hypothetical protein
MPSLEEFKQLMERLNEIENKKRTELGVGPRQSITKLLQSDIKYATLEDEIMNYDREIVRQYLKEKREASGGKRRRTKKSKRKHRKTMRR